LDGPRRCSSHGRSQYAPRWERGRARCRTLPIPTRAGGICAAVVAVVACSGKGQSDQRFPPALPTELAALPASVGNGLCPKGIWIRHGNTVAFQVPCTIAGGAGTTSIKAVASAFAKSRLLRELRIILIDPARLTAGPLEPIEHLCGRIDLVVVLALGKNVSSWRFSAGQPAFLGSWTKPFSIIAVWACRLSAKRSPGYASDGPSGLARGSSDAKGVAFGNAESASTCPTADGSG